MFSAGGHLTVEDDVDGEGGVHWDEAPRHLRHVEATRKRQALADLLRRVRRLNQLSCDVIHAQLYY